MKAVVITEFGGPEKLALAEVPAPKPGENQVLIEVKATALNRADLLQRRGLYPPPKGETEILGLECAGVVAELGPGVSAVQKGDRVMALLAGGGYAERVVCHERMAAPIPAGLSFEQAAAIPEAFLTAREALFTLGRIEPGGFVLVHASAGGVGSAAVQLAREHGARVIATAGSLEKLARVRELGAEVLVDYKTQDFEQVVSEVTQKKGVDVVLDFIGGSYWEKHARCLAVAGRCVVIGVLGGLSADVNFAQLLRMRHQLLGLVMRSRPLEEKIAITQRFIRESLPGFADGKLVPVIDRVFPIAEVRAAHERMEQNANIGKIVLAFAG
jgi:putative PIG3 family NAD(P)H quinone oxidoreductase